MSTFPTLLEAARELRAAVENGDETKALELAYLVEKLAEEPPVDETRERYRQVVAQLDVLRALLIRAQDHLVVYGSHLPDCSEVVAIPANEGCTCGFDDALSGVPTAAPEPCWRTPVGYAEAGIDLFLEFRDSHGYDEELARSKALEEVRQGTEADHGGRGCSDCRESVVVPDRPAACDHVWEPITLTCLNCGVSFAAAGSASGTGEHDD